MLWALLASGTFSGLPGPWYPVRVPSPYTSRCILTLPFLSHQSSSDAPCPLAPSRGLTSHPGWDTDRWIPYDLSEDDWALKLYLPCLCAWLTRDGISHARMPTKTPTENFSVGGWWFWLKEQPPNCSLPAFGSCRWFWLGASCGLLGLHPSSMVPCSRLLGWGLSAPLTGLSICCLNPHDTVIGVLRAGGPGPSVALTSLLESVDYMAILGSW